MPEYIARKRLKKKMLDRWENEGGRVSTEPTTADKGGSTNDRLSESKQLSDSSELDGWRTGIADKEAQAYSEMSRAQRPRARGPALEFTFA